MNTIIQNELNEFEKYHKNIYNLYFHVICGFIFMAFLFSSTKYSNILLILYSCLILFTIYNISITCIIFVGLFGIIYLVKKYKLQNQTAFFLFLIFYFLPDLSHYLTNEPPMLNMNTTPISLFANVFYLLPFSLYLIPKSLYLNQ